MIERAQLLTHLDTLLQAPRFKDYGPNGLQVEGQAQIHTLVSGVSASLALIQAAVDVGAQAMLVHHGLFWRGHDGCVTGWLRQRLALLLAHNINLYAYHLPLDAHPELGNNAQLGAVLGLQAQDRFGEQQLGWLGVPLVRKWASVDELAAHIGRQLGRAVTLVAGDARVPRRIAWCTGGAQGYFEAAIAAGADVFITGELSEPQVHYARESGVSFIACGHHASERYGAAALGAQVARQFGLVHQFIDIPSPA